MAKSKVLIVGKLPPPFIGPAVATKIILNSALKNKFDLVHLNTKVNDSLNDFGKGGFSKLLKNISIYFNLTRLLYSEKPNLILIPISQTTIGFLKDSIFILIASLFKTKILLQLRGSNFKNWMNSASVLTERYVRYCFNKTKGMIVLGHNLKHLFEDFYNLDQIYVVPNGCDILLPDRSKISKKVQLLYFANFLPSKGFKEVLEAIVYLKSKGVDSFEMKAIGAWDNEHYKMECFKILKDNNVNVDIQEPKSGELKWQAFANADVFLFTPNGPEGHPWVIVEAMAAGLAIISTNQGAIVESVINNQNGFIVSENNPKEIAGKLKELICNESLRIDYQKRSKKLYLEKFSESSMVENLTRTFKSII